MKAEFLAPLLVLSLFGCALPSAKSPAAKNDPKSGPKTACEPREAKAAARAPFLVESFRCSMQPGQSLNVGLRVYSSLDGKENTVIYGPDRMDTAPIANDSILYNGVKVILSQTSDAQTLYSFQHERISLQIKIPRSAPTTAAFEATYSDDAGAAGIRGFCVRVSSVAY